LLFFKQTSTRHRVACRMLAPMIVTKVYINNETGKAFVRNDEDLSNEYVIGRGDCVKFGREYYVVVGGYQIEQLQVLRLQRISAPGWMQLVHDGKNVYRTGYLD